MRYKLIPEQKKVLEVKVLLLQNQPFKTGPDWG